MFVEFSVFKWSVRLRVRTLWFLVMLPPVVLSGIILLNLPKYRTEERNTAEGKERIAKKIESTEGGRSGGRLCGKDKDAVERTLSLNLLHPAAARANTNVDLSRSITLRRTFLRSDTGNLLRVYSSVFFLVLLFSFLCFTFSSFVFFLFGCFYA